MLTSPDGLPDHAFGDLQVGEHYAYARGLTINPTHLPLALDRMRAHGWKLLTCFGQTNSAEIGFLFERN